jgi:hypothetical protein
MALFFKSLIGNRGVKEAFYDPLGSIFAGALSGYREGGHSDHVHVATYDRGGWLPPGVSLAVNRTGQPERIVGPGRERPLIININAPFDNRHDLARWLRQVVRNGGDDGFSLGAVAPGY